MKRTFWDGMCLGTMIGVVLGVTLAFGIGTIAAHQVQRQQAEFLKKLTDRPTIPAGTFENCIKTGCAVAVPN